MFLMVSWLLFIVIFLLVELVRIYMWFWFLLGLEIFNWLIIVFVGLCFFIFWLDNVIFVGFLLMFCSLIINDICIDNGGLLLFVEFIVIWCFEDNLKLRVVLLEVNNLFFWILKFVLELLIMV